MSSILLQYPKNPKVGGPNWSAKRGDPLEFFNISVAKHQNSTTSTLKSLKYFRKKFHSAEKKLKGGIVSPGIVCYAKKGKPSCSVR